MGLLERFRRRDAQPADAQPQPWPAPSGAAHDYYLAGLDLLGQGLYEQALAELRQAVRVRPDDSMTYFNMALAHDQLCQYGKAVDCYERALQLDPDFAEAYSGLGLA
ncbi:MAG: tetratricopeptide repeat protein, partial [Acidobacteriota bacterium]|nr:tetratricopeptide repeat protein [Acidobacteriota bacterium]